MLIITEKHFNEVVLATMVALDNAKNVGGLAVNVGVKGEAIQAAVHGMLATLNAGLPVLHDHEALMGRLSDGSDWRFPPALPKNRETA